MLTLGLLETKRESKADKSGDLAEIWGGFCVRELKLGEGAVTAVPGDVQSVSVGGRAPVVQRFHLLKWNCESARLSVLSK